MAGSWPSDRRLDRRVRSEMLDTGQWRAEVAWFQRGEVSGESQRRGGRRGVHCHVALIQLSPICIAKAFAMRCRGGNEMAKIATKRKKLSSMKLRPHFPPSIARKSTRLALLVLAHYFRQLFGSKRQGEAASNHPIQLCGMGPCHQSGYAS